MNWTQVESKWDQLKGRARSEWAKLTDDDMANLGGKKDQLLGKIVERYGIAKEQAELQVDRWLDRLDQENENLRDRNKSNES
jgi:uncharacterized protein YjbJ (UPF0337 family)